MRPLDLALSKPVETASGTMATAPVVLLDIYTGQGVTGSSYVRVYTPLALEPLAQLLRNLEIQLRRANAAPDVAGAKLQSTFRLLGPQGLTGIAMAAIDMALWDALAKARDVSLVRLLGGEPRPIPAYASLRSMSPNAAASEAAQMCELGFSAIKVKIGRGTLEDDLAAIRAVRNAIGSDARLMVDYNQSLPVENAIERVRILDDEGLYWIEEPTRADDFQGHARIAQAARTPIQLGENWWGPHDMQKSIAARASDHVMLDVMKLGGVSGWLEAAALAQAASLPASSHTFPEFTVHLLGVTPTCHLLEYLDHVGPILLQPVKLSNGFAITPDRPGAGVEWNEPLISKLATA
ncbi:MAG: enolase C-terminal domain-like protein [Candidatus Baltobacteraceae bacterium]